VFKRTLIALCAAVAIVATVAPSQASSITLLPNSSITGVRGTTIGWGYTIENTDALLYLLVVPFGAQVLFGDAAVSLDPYDFPTVGPASSVSQAYTGALGLISLSIFLNAPVGQIITGEVFGEMWFFDDINLTNLIRTENFTTQFTAVVPEPVTLALLGLGLAGTVARRRWSARA
jgi:hypothetical protein